MVCQEAAFETIAVLISRLDFPLRNKKKCFLLARQLFQQETLLVFNKAKCSET